MLAFVRKCPRRRQVGVQRVKMRGFGSGRWNSFRMRARRNFMVG